MTSVTLSDTRPKRDVEPVCGPCSAHVHDAHAPEYLDAAGVEQVCGCMCALADEDIVDFLERHEDGPCADCPIDLLVADLLR